MPVHREAPKCVSACNACRARKVKCSGEPRCTNCFDHGKECTYPKVPRGRRRKDIEGHPVTQSRLNRLDTTVNNTAAPHNSSATSDLQSSGGEYYDTIILQQDLVGRYRKQNSVKESGSEVPVTRISPQIQASPPSRSVNLKSSSTLTGSLANISISLAAVETPAMLAESYTLEGCQSELNNLYSSECNQSWEDDGLTAPQNLNWEQHAIGPTSWMSVCSDRGIGWVLEKTGVPEFARSAKKLSLGWTQRLKISGTMIRERAPEPDPHTAWKLCKAYFDEAYDGIFGVVFRPAFETRLRQQLEGHFPDDMSWYALRNVVYASGCRILLSKDPSLSFADVQQQAWSFFENAISTHTDLLCTPTGLPAVQAIALMIYYVEGLGSPSLEYTFCSSAVRLAQAKGLHRQVAKGWNLPESEVLHRSWLWWAIYCCDKHIARRSGRPSAIDDEDISCQIPTKIVAGSSIDITIFTSVIKHAQISSQISRRLGSMKALQRPFSHLVEVAGELTQSLQAWHEELPAYLKLKVSKNTMPTPPSSNARNEHLMHLHLAYHGSLMAINSIFSHPWVSAIFGMERNSTFSSQVLSSTKALAEAARNIILAIKYIGIDGASPHWLAFSYPMFSLINLFICVLKDPTSPTVSSDLALIDMVAGHFAHLDLATSSDMSFPFPREIAALARLTVTRALENVSARMAVAGLDSAQGSNDVTTGGNMDFENLDAFNLAEFDVEGWNVFSSFDVSFHDQQSCGNGG